MPPGRSFALKCSTNCSQLCCTRFCFFWWKGQEMRWALPCRTSSRWIFLRIGAFFIVYSCSKCNFIVKKVWMDFYPHLVNKVDHKCNQNVHFYSCFWEVIIHGFFCHNKKIHKSFQFLWGPKSTLTSDCSPFRLCVSLYGTMSPAYPPP